jgi:hypothetical protein
MAISEIIQKCKQRWSSFSTKKKVASIVVFLAVIIFPNITFRDSKEIKLVKYGSLNACPGKTVEQAAKDYFGSPKWSSGIGSDGPTKGLRLVNIQGEGGLNGKKVDIVLQFIVDENNDSFKLHAVEANGIPQPPIMIGGLLNNMCRK